MTEPVLIARCPSHGVLRGHVRCFDCGQLVEQVPMIPLAEHEQAMAKARETLGYLAEPGNWLGDPLDQRSTLHGHFTPFEMAQAALGQEEHDPR